MENILYVGNLPFDVTASELRARFAEYGEVANVQIVSDREPRRTRCFGVVTMRARADGAEAIRALNGSLLSGRSLVVSWMEGRVLSANPARSAEARDTRDTVPPLEDMTSRTHAAPAAKPRPAASFDEDGEPERRKKRHGAAAEAPPVRMLQQFRERTNMTYELECSGTPLVVRIFFPGEGPSPQWRVEVRTTTGSIVATATAASRALALESIARSWHDQDVTRAPSKVDWDSVTRVMAAVRAI